MFSLQNRQFIFRQPNGEVRSIFCDQRQNLCFNTLTRRGIWSNAAVLHKNVYQNFYAEIDQDENYHILFQDSGGNIIYSRLDGQNLKSVPVLNSKVPTAYDKQLCIVPFKNQVYLFYVLQHDNSFMLAYQMLANNRMGTPKVVDYVSGSSVPCSVIYDSNENIYAFYQSYDGKYLQLGFKKFNTAQKHWSDFMPITKYQGNCEYPHTLIDSNGIIHLCYQRRTPKLFEMVYQRKDPDKNLWSPEIVVHSSVHSFEKASILQTENRLVIFWVREDVIYYSESSIAGEGWSRPSRYSNQYGRSLQCICYKYLRPLPDRIQDARTRNSFKSSQDEPQSDHYGPQDGQYPSGSPDQRDEGRYVSSMAPEIYPGTAANGLKLAFVSIDQFGDLFGDRPSYPVSDYASEFREAGSPSPTGGDVRKIILDTFKQLQSSVDEVRVGWSENKKEMARLTNAYLELVKEMGKYTIRMNMLENQLKQLKKPAARDDSANREQAAVSGNGDENIDYASPSRHKASEPEAVSKFKAIDIDSMEGIPGTRRFSRTNAPKMPVSAHESNDMPVGADNIKPAIDDRKEPEEHTLPESRNAVSQQKDQKAPKKPGASLDPEKLKEWEEWQEPREWKERGE
ncbi:MAG TPA: hypothetical protein VHT96_03840 [Clostridia bacterium]|nr:hypothetical protein [Clostridia bacterium]